MAEFDTKESKWRVTTVKPKKQVAKKRRREDAIKDLEELDAGEHKWLRKHSPAAIMESMEKFDKNQKILPGRAARPEFDARTRVGNWWRGGPIKPKAPLESSKAKKLKGTTPIVSSLSPTKAAQKLLDTDNRSVKKLRTALSAMVQHCSQLKAKLGTAASEIAHSSRLLASGDGGEGTRAQEELECCQSSCQNADCSMQSHVSTKFKVVRELIGQGHDRSQ